VKCINFSNIKIKVYQLEAGVGNTCPVLVHLSCPEFQDRTKTKNIKTCPNFCPRPVNRTRTDTCPRTGLVRTGQKILKFACLRTGQKFPNLVPTPG
jgi:hypothetical protein